MNEPLDYYRCLPGVICCRQNQLAARIESVVFFFSFIRQSWILLSIPLRQVAMFQRGRPGGVVASLFLPSPSLICDNGGHQPDM